MALTASNMIELKTKAPGFYILDVVSQRKLSFEDVRGDNGTVVMFICNHCPYVIHVRDEIVKIANFYQNRGIGFVAISSNDVESYSEDSPELMAELAKQVRFPFPYLYDEDQSVAKAYNAACTPDFYLFDDDDLCVYRGRMDGSTPGNEISVTGGELRNAIDLLLDGKKIRTEQLPSMGCNIKWKS